MGQTLEDIAAEAAAEAADTPAPPAGSLEAAQALAAEVVVLEGRLARGEALMRELQTRKNTILGRELVDLMDMLKIEEMRVDGHTFTAAHYYHASIPEAERDRAHDWLETHGAGDLINNTVVAAFPKEHQEEAERLESYIRKKFQMAVVSRNRAVPWARLTSWLRELFEREDPEKVLPPLEMMGATVGRIVKIKPPKKTA